MFNKIKIAFIFSLLSLGGLQAQKHLPYKTVEGETISSICRKLSITPHDLLKLNPDIKNGFQEGQLLIVPNKNYKPVNNIEDGDYVEDGFLFHKVLPKETYYRFKQKYKVSRRDLRKHNIELRRSLRSDGIKTGSIIKIPVPDDFKLPGTSQESLTKPYLVLPLETKYMIARRYGINVEHLEKMNPKIIEGLQAEMIIEVPNTIEIPDEESTFLEYQIVKGDTYYNLSNRFKTTEERLIKLNPSLEIDGLALGKIIKIDKEVTTLEGVFSPSIFEGKEIKVAMLLPFKSNKPVDFEKERTANRVTDFYLGASVALDSLKKQGLSISMEVLDTQNNKTKVLEMVQLGKFDDVDVIIGPMYFDNVAVLASRTDKPLISPASAKDHGPIAHNSTVQATPQKEMMAGKMITYVMDNYTNQQLTVIIDDKPENQVEFNRIIAELSTLDTLAKISVLKPKEGFIRSDYYRAKVRKGRDNWVLLITDDNSITADVVQNLGVLPEEVKATLFTLYYGSNFNAIDNSFLTRLNLHFPTDSYIDTESITVKSFEKSYIEKYTLAPSDFSFKGFDVTYDALIRLASSQNYQNPFTAGNSSRTAARFNFVSVLGKGLVNEGAYIVKHENLNLVLVE